MKKVLNILLIVSMFLSVGVLSGCSSSKDLSFTSDGNIAKLKADVPEKLEVTKEAKQIFIDAYNQLSKAQYYKAYHTTSQYIDENKGIIGVAERYYENLESKNVGYHAWRFQIDVVGNDSAFVLDNINYDYDTNPNSQYEKGNYDENYRTINIHNFQINQILKVAKGEEKAEAFQSFESDGYTVLYVKCEETNYQTWGIGVDGPITIKYNPTFKIFIQDGHFVQIQTVFAENEPDFKGDYSIENITCIGDKKYKDFDYDKTVEKMSGFEGKTFADVIKELK